MTTPAGGYDWTAIYRQPVEDEAPAAGAAAEKAGAPDAEALAWMTGCSHDHAAEQRIFDMPDDVKLAACAAYKRTGNAYFREGCYDRALERYQRALIYYEYAFPEDPQRQFSMGRVRLTCLLNMVAAYIHLKRWSEAVGHAHQALSMVEELEELAPVVLAAAAAAAEPAAAVPVSAADAHSGCGHAPAPSTATAAADAPASTAASTGCAHPTGDDHGHGAGAEHPLAPAAPLPAAAASGLDGGRGSGVGGAATASFVRSLLCTARAKALYRRAVARRHLDDYDEAATDLALASAASAAAAGLAATGQGAGGAAAAAAGSSSGGVSGGIDPSIAREGRILARKRRAYDRKTARIARIMMGTAMAAAPAAASSGAVVSSERVPAAAVSTAGIGASAAEIEDDAADAAGDDDDDDAASVASDMTTGASVASGVGSVGELPLVFDVDDDDDSGRASGAAGGLGGWGKGTGMTTAALLALR